jgi:hypothetical protein
MHVVHHHFGVGFGAEHVAECLHPRSDRLVVLDDAVVDDANLESAARREMRVRIGLGRRTVRRPPRMRQPGAGLHPLFAYQLVEARHAARRAQPLEMAIPDVGHAGGIVAAIFEATDAFDEKVHDVARGGRADDAAHS